MFFYAFLGYLIALKTVEFNNIENAYTYLRQVPNENIEGQDLFSLNFRFAVTNLNKKLGEVEAYQVTHMYGKKVSEEKIDMVNCVDLVDDETWDIFFSFDRIRTKLNAGKLLCPDVSSIDVRNQWGDDVFSYLKLYVR